ncbi:MAG TPA: RidA family protein [Candidatus Bilophila faecipullorum]|uniref:RidA family protein n=1 Tax=Candidatus Bilophila faecipullorum TaxID=2838482 RepID=A0A9D1U932_9BACT|nr:RidA family protein [uncultured Bilophila sp.]HIW78703.1 RidA family protein [Candidatus Bilophila faecipullorum]
MKTVISTSKAPAAIGPYSQAIKSGDTLYLSGQIGMDPATGELVSADVKEQAAQALANMKAILAEAGATPANVSKVTVFIVDMADFQAVNAVYAETFGSEPPARSCVAVAALPKGARVEIEATAVL